MVLKRKGSRRPRRFMKKRYVRKSRARNANKIGGPNTCKVIETIPAIGVNLNTPYLVNKAGITGPRASAIAKEFGLYRIAHVKVTLRPLFDTYSSSLPGTGNYPNSLPTVYWKMNRYGDFPAGFAGDYMRSLGAKPNRLDDKQVTWSFKPNILVSQNNAANLPSTSQVKITPWLSTDDAPADNLFTLSTAQHYGFSMFIEGGGAGTATGVAALMDIQVVYEFKNPRLVVSANQTTVQTPAETLSL